VLASRVLASYWVPTSRTRTTTGRGRSIIGLTRNIKTQAAGEGRIIVFPARRLAWVSRLSLGCLHCRLFMCASCGPGGMKWQGMSYEKLHEIATILRHHRQELKYIESGGPSVHRIDTGHASCSCSAQTISAEWIGWCHCVLFTSNFLLTQPPRCLCVISGIYPCIYKILWGGRHTFSLSKSLSVSHTFNSHTFAHIRTIYLGECKKMSNKREDLPGAAAVVPTPLAPAAVAPSEPAKAIDAAPSVVLETPRRLHPYRPAFSSSFIKPGSFF
jgi:hypothetical protein